MANITLSLTERYIAAFGQVAISKALKSQKKDSNDYSLELFEESDKTFENIKLKIDTKEVRFGSMLFTGESDSEVVAPPPFISFEQSKNLIETEINGTDNIVVERWGTKPWSIRMRGLLIDMKNHHYPELQVKELRKLFQYNGVVDCYGKQFIDKQIKSLYFKRVTFQGVEGFQDTIQYTIEARSIRPVGFTLLNPNS
jgi:hypothetical protein